MTGNDRNGNGIVGCGPIADPQVPGCLAIPRARLVAVRDAPPGGAERRRRECGARHAHVSIAALRSAAASREAPLAEAG